MRHSGPIPGAAKPGSSALALGLLLALLWGCAATPELRPADGAREADALRSAGLLRASGADRDPLPARVEEQALLRRHFDAVLARLEADTPRSLDLAVARAAAALGIGSPFELAALRVRLEAARERNLAVLRGYRDAARFPRNDVVSDRAVPIFVDARDTACAVGFLMRASGWEAEVAAIARDDLHVFVDDVSAGPLLAWVATSGLTREEAALIQPTYAPPPAEATVAGLIAEDGTLERYGVRYSNFAFEALLHEPGGVSEAPLDLVDPASFGVSTLRYNSPRLFFGASVLDGVGGLATLEPPFGEDGSTLRITVAFDAAPLDPRFAINRLTLQTFDYYIYGGNFAAPGDLAIATQVFGGNGALLASHLAVEESSSFLYDYANLALAQQASLRVVTETTLSGPGEFTYWINRFGLVATPEPGTGVLLAWGLALLGARRRRRS
jgi:hypothetical protein